MNVKMPGIHLNDAVIQLIIRPLLPQESCHGCRKVFLKLLEYSSVKIGYLFRKERI